jgi:carbamoyltransferase
MSVNATYVLGINLSHDASACLLKDGKICVAIEKERLTRTKHDDGNDSLAVQYCLDAEGITINDLALVVQNANFEKDEIEVHSYLGERLFPKDYQVPVISISHHLAHAYSTIGTCPFTDDYTIYVVDGCGSPYRQCDDLQGEIPKKEFIEKTPQNFWCEKDSFYQYKNGKLHPVYKDFSPFNHFVQKQPFTPPTTLHSIGGLYSAASRYCFGNGDATGKLMGLSPYGKEGVFKDEIFELKDGRLFVNTDWMTAFQQPADTYHEFQKNFQYYANIARWVQNETERALLYLFKHRQNMQPSANMCYAGGVALNAVANHRILAETNVTQLYIQPAAADNGIALGCAFYGWLEVLKKEKVSHNGASNFGKKYFISNKAIEQANITVKETKSWMDEAAELLAKEKVIAWFVGGSEFGPRALGYRSILAHPEAEGMRDYINREIKLREDFRPFAPAVLREDVTQYFQYDWDTPYMIQVNPVKPEWKERLKNVVHLNDTARVQTVSQKNNPHFYSLITKFKALTGLSLVLNTSFNSMGMPIVETPQEAIDFFKQSPLDALVMENRILTKANAKVS